MIPFLIVRTADGLIRGVSWQPDPETGPTLPGHPLPDGHGYVADTWGFTREGHGESEDAFLVNDAVAWVDRVELAGHRTRALQQIDAFAEALRLAVVNHLPMQTEEYRQALQQAQAWRAADYPETDEQPAPPDVTCWAMAKWRAGWSARQACDDILSTAALWEAVLSKVRMLRLVNKEDVRHAGDVAAINAIVADMRADMQKIAQQMGLSSQFDNSTTFTEV